MLDNVCVCCGKEIPEGRQVCKSCETEGQRMGLLSKPAVVTNFDRIRAMSVEQLAEFIDEVTDCCSDGWLCHKCPIRVGSCDKESFIDWLKQEASP